MIAQVERFALVALVSCSSVAPPAVTNARRSSDDTVAKVLAHGGTLYVLTPDWACDRWDADVAKHVLVRHSTSPDFPDCKRMWEAQLAYRFADDDLQLITANEVQTAEQGCAGTHELSRPGPVECRFGKVHLEPVTGGAVLYHARALLFVDAAACRASLSRAKELERGNVCNR